MSKRWRETRILACVVAGVTLAGCASPGCDPNQAGFLSGIGNASSGCYARRTEAYRQQLQLSIEQREQARAGAIDAAARQQAEEANLEQLRQRLSVLDRQMLNLQGRLNAARRRAGVNEASLRRAEAALKEFARQRAAAAAAPTSEAVAAAEAQQRQAEDNIRALLIAQ